MTVYVGKTNWWWRDSPNAPIACKVKATIRLNGVGATLTDGSTIICATGGTAWIVAPSCTQVSSGWNGSTNTLVGNKCCICEWSGLETQLINCGFNPCDWFVPSYTQLQNPGYVCRTNWDSFSTTVYWSSTETIADFACVVCYSNGCAFGCTKTGGRCVRAFRCVTY